MDSSFSFFLFFFNNLIYSFDPNLNIAALNPLSGATTFNLPLNVDYFSGRPSLLQHNLYMIGLNNNNPGFFIKSINIVTGDSIYKKYINTECVLQQVVGNNIFTLESSPNKRIMVYNRNTGVAKDSVSLTASEIGGIGIVTYSGNYIPYMY